MRTLFFLIFFAITYSCSRTADLGYEPSPYDGTYYHMTNKDTAYVSNNEPYLKIRWAVEGTGAKITFDSVVIHQDKTFTVNEYVDYFGVVRAIGTGKFTNNNLQFDIVVDGGHCLFNGLK